MKRVFLFSAIVILFVSFLKAQTADDLYNADTFTWYGLDYTDAYFLTPIDGFKSTHMTPEKVQEIVSSYNTENDEPGTGIVFIVESLSKPELQGAYWLTFFDIKSKKVIKTGRYTGKPGGFGLRNYWAESYYNVMREAGKEFQ